MPDDVFLDDLILCSPCIDRRSYKLATLVQQPKGQAFVTNYAVQELGREGYYVLSVQFQNMVKDVRKEFFETPFWHADEAETSIGMYAFGEFIDMSRCVDENGEPLHNVGGTPLLDRRFVQAPTKAAVNKPLRFDEGTVSTPEWGDLKYGVIGLYAAVPGGVRKRRNTHGRIDVQVFYSSQLGDENEMLMQARQNDIQMYVSNPVKTSGTIKAHAALEGFFLYDDWDHAMRFLDSETDYYLIYGLRLSQYFVVELAKRTKKAITLVPQSRRDFKVRPCGDERPPARHGTQGGISLSGDGGPLSGG